MDPSEAEAAAGRAATGETIDRKRVSATVYPSIWYWMGFFINAVVVPNPNAPGAGDNNGGVGASAVIPPVGGRHGSSDNQENGNYCISGLIDT